MCESLERWLVKWYKKRGEKRYHLFTELNLVLLNDGLVVFVVIKMYFLFLFFYSLAVNCCNLNWLEICQKRLSSKSIWRTKGSFYLCNSWHMYQTSDHWICCMFAMWLVINYSANLHWNSWCVYVYVYVVVVTMKQFVLCNFCQLCVIRCSQQYMSIDGHCKSNQFVQSKHQIYWQWFGFSKELELYWI